MKNVFVGNLSFGATEEAVRSIFEEYGVVQPVNLIRDRDTGRAKGFGFVEMTNGAEADSAIAELNGRELDGRALNVDEARPRSERDFGDCHRSGGGNGRSRNRGKLIEMRAARAPSPAQGSLSQDLGRKIFLRLVPRDAERCLIDASVNDTVAFRGDAVDAPVLCCGHCHAPLVVAVDRLRLTNMVIECGRCGNFNRTRE